MSPDPTATPTIGALYHKGLRTGGPEAIHQLVRALRDLGHDAVLVPHPDTAQASPVAEFAHYQCPEVQLADLDTEAELIFPEIYAQLALEPSSRRHAIWWLSIDNSPAFASVRGWLEGRHGEVSAGGLPRALVRDVRARRLRRRLRADSRVQHYFQSEYARRVIANRVGAGGSMLTDYVAQAPVPAPPERASTVAYNPRKGGRFVARLARRMPDVTFVPLENMTPVEMATTLSASTIYLDAGHHPGRDRIPREARLAGCVIIVARRGSAANDTDVPLPQQYKFSYGRKTDELRVLIRDCLSRPAVHAARQDSYTSVIRAQRGAFQDEVRKAFGP
ncbi:hypothetical protein LRP67_03530 [Nocardioides sp. cx-169]|uniref:hypothetical protein n=1 Tax=Nocardioides sp. cx-169 TaxID=2899080 RepID=UPI001E3ACA24|nr:hypothetical protein [Nocardioides sp. cx-169]MCD4533149.1 hypothetical protein [Nocardioides sp. cx-169]